MNLHKKTYSSPEIEEIRLDNEISLQLASVGQSATPPGNPTSATQGAPRMKTNESDPYQYENW